MAFIAPGRESPHRPAVFSGTTVEDRPCDHDGIAAAIPQRRDPHGDLADPVIQVLAELAGLDHRGGVLVGGADDAHVDRDAVASADALDDAVLQEAQQLRLQGQRHVADLVEEDRAAVGLLELALGLLARRR